MDENFLRIAEINGGYIYRRQLLDHGYTDDHIRQAVRAEVLVKLRHGTYATRREFSALSPTAQHRVVARSVVDKLGDTVALSHISAAAEHGLDSHDLDFTTVHVTRLGKANGRREAGVVHHKGVVDDSELVEKDGRLIIEPARAVVEVCMLASIESGMVTASSALRTEQVDEQQLQAMAARFDRWKGVRHARIACKLADQDLESVGEVRSFHMAWRWNLPRPQLQFEVFDARGVLLGRSDFAWPEFRHLGEFDGLIKYGRLNPYSTDPGQAIVDEKLREDLLRAEAWGMSRWVWPA